MARPTFPVIEHGLEAWDSTVNDGFDLIGTTPVPLAVFTVATLPDPAAYDECVCFVSDWPVVGKALVISDGAAWKAIPTQAAATADTTAADLAALKVDFNAFLATLRATGVIAT